MILVPALVSFNGEELELDLFSSFTSEAVDVEDEMAGKTDNEEFTTWTWHGFLLPPSDLLNLTVSLTGGRFSGEV